jgi:hypothetical protein
MSSLLPAFIHRRAALKPHCCEGGRRGIRNIQEGKKEELYLALELCKTGQSKTIGVLNDIFSRTISPLPRILPRFAWIIRCTVCYSIGLIGINLNQSGQLVYLLGLVRTQSREREMSCVGGLGSAEDPAGSQGPHKI